jgi:hypothetical protein
MLKIWKQPIYFYVAELMIFFTFVQFPYIVYLLMFIVLLNLEQIVHKCTLIFKHSVSVLCWDGHTSSYDLF